MSGQPKALRLAEFCDFNVLYQPAATELRRLHEENGRLRIVAEMSTLLLAQRGELLEALKLARSIIGHPDDAHSKLIDAAIKKAEGTE